DPCTVAHIKSLKIPAVGSRPGILIDSVGRFTENDTLRARIDNIFDKNAQTFLVNSSGTGKTRLSLEGLCRHWGFYFTMALDGNALGAGDSGPGVQDRIRFETDFEMKLPPYDSLEFSSKRRRNIEIVDYRFAQVLLGRLLAFVLYSVISRVSGI
ncbi:hypothetical protein C8R47DRAFT_942983, partial [Mycena vitilis]